MNWNDIIIGQNAVIKGELRSVANIIVRGLVNGQLSSDGDILIMNKGAVKGKIESVEITIDGTVEGEIQAKKISINSTGQLLGDLTTSTLKIDEGGTFIGSSKKSNVQTESKIKSFEPIYEL